MQQHSFQATRQQLLSGPSLTFIINLLSKLLQVHYIFKTMGNSLQFYYKISILNKILKSPDILHSVAIVSDTMQYHYDLIVLAAIVSPINNLMSS